MDQPSRNGTFARTLLASSLMACGILLVILGARTLWESHFGQTDAAREFRAATPAVPSELRPAPLRVGDTVGKMTIPRLGTDLFVMEGDGARELRRGPGHIAGSAAPGGRGNCIIAGHRDTHFRVLKDIRTGDDIVVQTAAGRFVYRVTGTQVVAPTDTRALQQTPVPVLRLITCYPFYYVGSAPKRFVVEARLAEAKAKPVK